MKLKNLIGDLLTNEEREFGISLRSVPGLYVRSPHGKMQIRLHLSPTTQKVRVVKNFTTPTVVIEPTLMIINVEVEK